MRTVASSQLPVVSKDKKSQADPATDRAVQPVGDWKNPGKVKKAES